VIARDREIGETKILPLINTDDTDQENGFTAETRRRGEHRCKLVEREQLCPLNLHWLVA